MVLLVEKRDIYFLIGREKMAEFEAQPLCTFQTFNMYEFQTYIVSEYLRHIFMS